jgi:hypothetical protein
MTGSADQLPEYSDCLNCGARLSGQYCGQCGQRASSRLISLWELTRDAFGDLFELDSRLWRTLVPLLISPGKLTKDYLEGRRARYMPPFRMYLVLSVVFFVIAFFDPRDDLSLLFAPEPVPPPEEQAAAPEEQAAAIEEQIDAGNQQVSEAQKKIDELVAEGRLSEDQAKEALDALEDLGKDGSIGISGDSEDGGLNFNIDPETGECNFNEAAVDEMPEWLRKRLTPERLQHICERIAADKGKNFISLLLDNVPVALIVLLPVMALVLKALYPLSRRYFVEHLLFFVHFHAFFFLILTLQILFSRLVSLTFIPDPISVLVIVAASFYIPVYLYKAMRRVYGQGHLLTFTKYIALSVAYIAGAAVTMLGALVFALFSV